ncbi:unnamed protein product, partial [Didymodactylos carnosus]
MSHIRLLITELDFSTIYTSYYEKHKQDEPTITYVLANNDRFSNISTPKDAAEYLFPPSVLPKPKNVLTKVLYQLKHHKKIKPNGNDEREEINLAEEFYRTKYPEQCPSELFLKILNDVFLVLEDDPLSGVVSPSLIASTGVIPYTVISTIPDIMEHYYQVIVNAKREILFATNYWEKGHSVTTVGNALKELSKRAASDNRRVIVKLMIDHPTAENIAHSFHNLLPVGKWSHYDIPHPDEIPYVDLEIMNYHRLIMGTFHSKFLVSDRHIALLNSNNIQDRP